MRQLCKTLLAAAAVAVSVAAAPLQAQERTLKFAFQNVKEHPQGLGAQKFADLVSQKSGGKMKVTLFPGGTLGGDLQTVSALQGGTIDVTVLNSGLLVGVVKEFAVVDLPFLFNDAKEADAIVDGAIGKQLASRLPEKGLVSLAYWDLGFRNVTNSKRPITKVEDLQGLKIRVVQSPVFIDLFNALGANPVPMPFPEVYSALEQKVVDGQENPYTVIATSKFQEVQKFASTTRHIYNPQSLLISKKTWDKLSEGERKIVQEAATEATAYQRQVSRDRNAAAMDTIKSAGVQISDISPAELARMREKVKPVVDKYSAQIGEPLLKELNAELAKMRGGK
jgi:tripartite ATP-independent transporter DctP family solute receptor